MDMQILLFGVILLLIAYMVYSDSQNRKERAELELKLMAKSLEEYKSVTEDTPQDSPPQDKDPYLEMDEVTADQIIGAKQ